MDADSVDIDVSNEVEAIPELGDVEVTLLTPTERQMKNSITTGQRMFRSYAVKCQQIPWIFIDRYSDISDMFTLWEIDLCDKVQKLYGEDFIDLQNTICDDYCQIYEVGGLTLTLRRCGIETKVPLRAATLGSEVCACLTRFDIFCIVC